MTLRHTWKNPFAGHLLPAAVLACLLLAPAVARATEVRWRSVSHFTKLEVKPLGDAEGHVAGTWVRGGLCFVGKDVGVYAASGSVDLTRGAGSAKGESSCTFPDGSSFRSSMENGVQPLPGGLSTYQGTARFVGGTGRFEGIEGSSTFKGRTYTTMGPDTRGDLVVDVVSRYTLPKRK